MIPKRAIFYWEGNPMSWLRRQSIETFRLLNPSWEVVIIGPELSPEIKGTSRRFIGNRSDLARYRELAARGGVYFDSDIIFRRPIPEAWTAKDVTIAISDDGDPASIACLGSIPGARFFEWMEQAALKRIALKIPCEYQSVGIKLLWDLCGEGMKLPTVISGMGHSVTLIKLGALIPVSWAYTEYLWTEQRKPLEEGHIGVHWFGGDEISQDYETELDFGTWDSMPCLVTDAIRDAYQYAAQGEPEAHRVASGL